LSINLISHEPFFYLVRPIRSLSGEKLGLMVAGLSPSFFTSFYQSAVLGGLNISLIRRDGVVLSRNFDSIYPFNKKYQLSPEALQHIKTTDGGIYYIGGQGTPQSFDEMVAFERSPLLPIGMIAAVSKTQIFAEWERQAVIFIIIGVGMSSLVLILTLFLTRLVRQVEQARNDALHAADAKTRFVANISHELRTPMNTILAGAHQLRQADLKPDAQRMLQMVSSSAQQLTVLINDILDFSYFDAREFRIETAPFDPRSLTQNVMDMAQALAPETRLELVSKFRPLS
jgi:signal transduction histidine kinase